jgi:hypothetical protein
MRSKASAIAIADNFFICPPSFLKFKWTVLQRKLKKNQYRRIEPLLIVVAEPAEKVTGMEQRVGGWRSVSLEVGGVIQLAENN